MALSARQRATLSRSVTVPRAVCAVEGGQAKNVIRAAEVHISVRRGPTARFNADPQSNLSAVAGSGEAKVRVRRTGRGR